MALILHSSTACAAKTHHFLLSKTLPKSTLLLPPIKSQNSSSEPPIFTQSADDTSSPPPTSTGLGFGSSSSSSTTTKAATAKKKTNKGRASIIRRAPVETPQFVSKQEEAKLEEQSQNEKAFLLAWLGLGSIIITQGLLLAASGFLPEEWDKLLVKYLYPAFTPTVFLFVAGTVAYGVLKYLGNQKPESPK